MHFVLTFRENLIGFGGNRTRFLLIELTRVEYHHVSEVIFLCIRFVNRQPIYRHAGNQPASQDRTNRAIRRH